MQSNAELVQENESLKQENCSLKQQLDSISQQKMQQDEELEQLIQRARLLFGIGRSAVPEYSPTVPRSQILSEILHEFSEIKTASNIAFWTFSVAHGSVEFGPQMKAILGLQDTSLNVPLHQFLELAVYPPDFSVVYSQFERAISSGSPIDVTARLKSDTSRWIIWKVHGLFFFFHSFLNFRFSLFFRGTQLFPTQPSQDV